MGKGGGSMPILDKTNPEECNRFDAFMQTHPHSSYTQSLAWAKVKQNWDNEAVYVENDRGQITGAALVLIRHVPVLKKTILYTPRGPVWNWEDGETFHQLLLMLQILAKRHKAYKIVIDPYFMATDQKEIDLVKSYDFTFMPDAPPLTTIQSRTTYVLDIAGKTAEEVFSGFHSKWRYNTRLAGRKGVECRVCTVEEALDDFYELMLQTSARDGFTPRSKSYFENFIRSLGDCCRLYMCYQGDTPLSGAITTNYAGRTFYVYGASSNEHRNLMPNYLMQWTMMQWAIETGCSIYDFGGIAFYEDESNPAHGVYKFKRGFGGRVCVYAGEFTLLLDKKVDYIEKAFKKVKKILKK